MSSQNLKSTKTIILARTTQRVNATGINRVKTKLNKFKIPIRPKPSKPQTSKVKIVTERNVIKFKPGYKIVISVEADNQFDIYYAKDSIPSTSNYINKYIKVAANLFSITDDFATNLNIMILRNSNVKVSIDYEYVKLNEAKKYAIVIGISDYSKISDLNFCDEDASDWANYLLAKGYQCIILGDKHVINYPHYNGLATEENVRNYIQKITNLTDETSKFAFVSSGHGSGDGKGNSFLCMYDYNGKPNGQYTDKEFSNDIEKIKGEKFVFLDHCNSGGLLDELQLHDNIFATSTCTSSGFGWDMEQFNNGAWTYVFLKKALLEHFINSDPTLQDVFDYAKSIFKTVTNRNSEWDQPCMINTGTNMKL